MLATHVGLGKLDISSGTFSQSCGNDKQCENENGKVDRKVGKNMKSNLPIVALPKGHIRTKLTD